MRCSFEETVDVLAEASTFSSTENARGVSTSIMLGQRAAFGTGAVSVRFPRLPNAKPSEPKEAVLRSSCRSFLTSLTTQVSLEYVVGSDYTEAVRPFSPPEDCLSRKRARFRMRSPSGTTSTPRS